MDRKTFGHFCPPDKPFDMLTFLPFRIIIVSTFLGFVLAGCSPTMQESSHGMAPPSSAAEQQKTEAEATKPSPAVEPVSEKTAAEPSQTAREVDLQQGHDSGPGPEVQVEAADIAFVRERLAEYENKFDRWLEISETTPKGPLADELTALETECMQQLENILTGYNLLLETMLQNETVPVDKMATVDPKLMQQLDISFLEGRCSYLLAMDMGYQYEFIPETALKPSFEEAQEAFIALVEQEQYQDALFAYRRLSLDFKDRQPSLATRLHYGLALQYTGQVETAARYFKDILASGDLAMGPLGVQREIADLLFAAGDVTAAQSYYEAVVQSYDSLTAETKWAEAQLGFLQEIAPGSEDMNAFIKLLRTFRTYDYKSNAVRLNELTNTFAQEHAGSPVAVNAMRLKAFAQEQVKAWFGRQLILIDSLVAEKKFSAATDILHNMTRYYLPADLQAVVQKTYYDVAQAEIQEKETQRRQQEMELSGQWDSAVNLLDSQQYDAAISAFEAFKGTEYEERAVVKIVEAANQAAGQMRKEAASLFISAGKTQDYDQKKALLLESYRLLREIPRKYPQTDLLDKVQQNIAILEKQIERIDPALLDERRQENSTATPLPPADPGAEAQP